MPQPNFFLVGAPKAGTTSLYHALRQHPQIFMSPIKEPCHFSLEVRPENFTPALRQRAMRMEKETLRYLLGPMDTPRSGGIVREWDDYVKLFAGVRGEPAIGEASVGYLVSPHAADAIARGIPQAKILMVLRAPSDRAFSQYQHCVSDGLVRSSFHDYVRACLRHADEGLGIHRPFLEMGFYAEQVQRFLDRFPRSQIGIWIYEETLLHPRQFLQQVFRFLDVDDDFEPDISMRHHEPRIPRLTTAAKALHWARTTRLCREFMPAQIRAAIRDMVYRPRCTTRMSREDNALMMNFYRADIHRLEGILGRDLGLWLEHGGGRRSWGGTMQ